MGIQNGFVLPVIAYHIVVVYTVLSYGSVFFIQLLSLHIRARNIQEWVMHHCNILELKGRNLGWLIGLYFTWHPSSRKATHTDISNTKAFMDFMSENGKP